MTFPPFKFLDDFLVNNNRSLPHDDDSLFGVFSPSEALSFRLDFVWIQRILTNRRRVDNDDKSRLRVNARDDKPLIWMCHHCLEDDNSSRQHRSHPNEEFHLDLKNFDEIQSKGEGFRWREDARGELLSRGREGPSFIGKSPKNLKLTKILLFKI